MKTSYRELDYESGKALQTLRGRMGLTQVGLAEHLGISMRTVNGWEAGRNYPKTAYLKKLLALAVQRQAFVKGSEAEEIHRLWTVTHQKVLLDEHWLSVLLSGHHSPRPQTAEARVEETRSLAPLRACPASEPQEDTPPVIQNLPFPSNPFFTGRQSLLEHLEHLFESNERVAITQPVSISGLGGIGKTQLALEYAHRSHPHIYRCVFWVNASGKASLEASYLALAHLLKLSEEKERETNRIVQAVKLWLEKYPHWLLILDNADDLELARSYLPAKPRGRILLTTRSQIVGTIARVIQVETFSPEEGLLFLLRRSGVLSSETEPESIAADIRHATAELVELLSGHPLALDQAGAYIEETGDSDLCATNAVFTEYRQLYQEQRRTLLKMRGSVGGEHPDSVALTIEISVKSACERHPQCADVLAFCSLLHPDAIPEELLHQGLGLDRLHFNEVIRALRSSSLIKRNADKQVLSLHRLVQAVIKDGMNEQNVQNLKERVLQVLNDAFPEVTFKEWKRCERYLPHALIYMNAPVHEVVAPLQVAPLLTKAGTYLQERGLYADAEPLLVRALSLREQHVGTEHPDTAMTLSNLAILYRQQGKYELAEPLFQRALLTLEQHLGASHPHIAQSLNNLAIISKEQGKHELAESLYQRALAIYEQHLGPEHPDTALSLSNLANLYREQGKYELAEPLHQRALAIREQHLGPEHPNTALSLNNLAKLYREQGKYELAEPLHQRALAIWEQHLGPEHPRTADSLNDLAILYWQQGKYEQAESLYQRALAIREQCLGPEHSDIAQSLNNLAIIYKEQGKYELAESLYRRALSIWEQHLGPEHPKTAASLYNLAELYWLQGKYEQGKPLYLRALTIFEQQLGVEHSLVAEVLHGLAELYRHQGKYELAEPLYRRALSIREKCLGAEHPDTAQPLHGLAELYQHQGKYKLAEPLFQRALSIREQRLGLTHPDTQKTCTAYAAFLRLRGREASATDLES